MPLVPKEIVDQKLAAYTQEEQERILVDSRLIEALIFVFLEPAKKGQAPEYVATAGAPGTKKTTTIEEFYTEHKWHKKYAYADPDVMLLLMVNTHMRDVVGKDAANEVRRLMEDPGVSAVDVARFARRMIAQSKAEGGEAAAAYEKWRGASQFLAERVLNRAFDGNYHILHGTTSTAPVMARLYQTLKSAGRTISLKLFTAPDSVRWEAVDRRQNDLNIAQVTESDVKAKGAMFFERLPDYFEHADQIEVFWSDRLAQKPQLCRSFGTDVKGRSPWMQEQPWKQFLKFIAVNGVDINRLYALRQQRREEARKPRDKKPRRGNNVDPA